MAVLHPFRALRPTPEKANQVAAVPYDVVNRSEAFSLAEKNPWSFLHVSRSEIDLPLETDPLSSSVYEKAAENFKHLLRTCPFIQEEHPSLYLYQLKMGSHIQIGVAGCYSLDEYDSNLIKKHEKTRKEKEDDRTRHTLTLGAQTGPVFLTFEDVPEINQEIARVQSLPPLYQFTAEDAVTHTLWKIPSPDLWVTLFAKKVPALYIADGHHRAAAASRTRDQLRQQNSRHQGNEEYNFFLAVAFPGSQLRILPYHRVVKDLNGLSEAAFLEKIQTRFQILGEGSLPESKIPQQAHFGMFLSGKWLHLKASRASSSTLDTVLLQENLLGPILGIGDPRTDPRIDFIGGIRGTQALEQKVLSGQAQVAFTLHPTQLADVIRISNEGGIMPPKSTWFEPKLRDGLLCHCLE